MEGRARAGSIAVAVAACLWGAWGVVLRASGVGAVQAACVALFTMGVLGAPLLPRPIPRERSLWIALGAVGIFDAGNTVLFFAALERGPIGLAVLSHYLAPVLVALLSPVVLGGWPGRRTLVALPVSLAGLALLLGDDIWRLGGALPTAALGAGSAVFYAINVVISKRAGDRLAPAELLVYHVWISALILAPIALSAPAPPPWGIMTIIAGAAASGVGGGLLFLWGLARIPAARAGILAYLEPTVGVALGVLVLGERMAPLAPLGALLIVGAGVGARDVPRSPPRSAGDAAGPGTTRQ